MKPPPQGPAKDSTPGSAAGGRKTSLSHSQSHLNSFNTASPTSSRLTNRRRETGDSASLSNPLSPTGINRFFRDEPTAAEPPPSLLRRKTDFKEADDREKDGQARENQTDLNSPFAPLKRSTTGPFSAGLNGTSSPWPSAPQSAGFSPMGAFGNFALGTGSAQASMTEKKSGFGSLRGESRFKGLLSKDSSDDVGSGIREKHSFGSLEKLPEPEGDNFQQRWGDSAKTRALRSESNPFGVEEPRSGSAALGGARDFSPSGQGLDNLGLSTLAMSSNFSDFRDLTHHQSQDFAHHHTPQSQHHSQEPMSPTTTNPYQSPDGDKGDTEDVDTDGSDIQHSHLPGLSGLRGDSVTAPFSSIRRGGSSALDTAAGDRSQTSSAGQNRGFASLGGFAGLSNLNSQSGWPGSAGAVGTPSRERAGFSGFGDPLFGSMTDLQSPNLASLGGSGFFGPPAGLTSSGTIGRSSKMGSLFPPAMQEQMRGEQSRQDVAAGEGSERQLGDVGRNFPGNLSVDTESTRRDPEMSSRGGSDFFNDPASLDRFMRGSEDSGLPADASSSIGQPTVTGPSHMPISSTTGLSGMASIGPSIQGTPQTGQALSQSSGSNSSNQLPAAQQRQMVMPDRMRWIYRDIEGNTQGPWSGLEMHDWFKAGFFTAELQVKKLEDTEYEPLAQLVRKIGNSREPFLVPQIGVPHGPASSQVTHWTGPGAAAGPPTASSQSGTAQPPFASSFPSFGTTLTAEQQNALERRKQEEQYLMARQKEHLAQQQVILKQQMHLQGGIHPHQLQHHSSAHSLHSQPSFSSITSPSGYQPSPIQGPIQPPQNVPPSFDGPMRQNPSSNLGPSILGGDMLSGSREEELSGLLGRMNVGRSGHLPVNLGPSYGSRLQENLTHEQQVAQMLQDRARPQLEQERHLPQTQNEGFSENQGQNERLHQFNSLRSLVDEQPELRSPEDNSSQPIGASSRSPPEEGFRRPQMQEDGSNLAGLPQGAQPSQAIQHEPETVSLSQQVQKAAAASSQQPQPTQTESPWSKVESGLPHPFPPPLSVSPLPAPAAQRNRQNVADTLAAESRSQTQTPVDTPSASIAPWAKESGEGPKGPSLKEIQEIEARKAAQQEEIAAAARRALAEHERLNQPTAPAPGLPSSSTWGTGASPATPTATNTSPSVWAKALAGKAPAVPNAQSAKKTLTQIQREEEARKQRLAAANAAQSVAANPTLSAGKRYADLASKIATTGPTVPSSAWTTVGASGKAKAPTTVVATAPSGPRAVSGNMPTAAATTKLRPAATTTRSSTLGAPLSSQNKAADELSKWAKSALGKGLNNTINGERSNVHL